MPSRKPILRRSPRLWRVALALAALAAMLGAHLCAGLAPAMASPSTHQAVAHALDCDHAAGEARPDDPRDPRRALAASACALMCCAVAPAPLGPHPVRAAKRGEPVAAPAARPWTSLDRPPPSPPPRA